MEIFLLFGGAIGLGFLLIVLIAIGSPARAMVDLRKESDNDPLIELDSEQLGRLVAALIERMGLEVERWQGGKNEVVEIFATNPTPVTGGNFLIHCITAPSETGRIDGLGVAKFIRATRTAYVSKGLLFTTGTFTPDAMRETEGAPVELFDRARIHQMVKQHFESEDAAAVIPSEMPAGKSSAPN